MIKTFEQFVAAKYGSPMNEAFQSSKLREIIKQHGKPRCSWENKMLYDLKDDEIIDVVANREEYEEKYLNNKSEEQATFMLELKDRACIVISNLDIFNDHKDECKARFEKDELFRKRRNERHKGNLGKHPGNDVHSQHLDNVTDLMKNRFMKNLDKNIPELISDINDVLDDESIFHDYDKSDDYEYYFDTEYNGAKCSVIVHYDLQFGEEYEDCGGYYCNATVSLKDFYVDFGRDAITDEEMGITPKTYPDLFADHEFEEIERGIADPYEFYGVSRSDFF
jgi:hypothetical protein